MSTVQIFEFEWQGIRLSVTHRHKCWGIIEHLEIKSLDPPKAPLPITSTGYKSHFIPEEVLEGFNDARSYVLEWLESEACKPEWKAQELSARQYSLF